jgi:hypothetical protein
MVTRRVALPVLPVVVDTERRDRGVTMEAWLAAPSPPLHSWECEDPNGELELVNVRTGERELVPARPCPALRCKYHVGLRGDGSFSCQRDFAALPEAERTFDRIAAATGLIQEAVVRTAERVIDRNQRDSGDVTPEAKAAIALGLLRRHA